MEENKDKSETKEILLLENKKFPKKKESSVSPYRPLNIKERDFLYALYEYYGGNMSQVILDKTCLFRSYAQLNHYCNFYNFKNRFIENRLKKAEEINKKLHDAKMRAVENAMRILEAHNVFVYRKDGVQIFDNDGNPLIVERLPFYKEIKTAWEIIKTELGEPTTISKGDITSGGKPITREIKITIEDFSNEPKNQ